MPKVTVTHSCGHQERHDLTGNASTRAWRAGRLAEDLCSDCFRAAREAESAAAAASAAEAGLPPLRGSDRQVQWAETIRAKKLHVIARALVADLSPLEVSTLWGDADPADPALPGLVDALHAMDSAHWWIDGRDLKSTALLLLVAATSAPSSAPSQAAHEDVLAEAIVRPEQPVTPTPTEIRVAGSRIDLIFPERRDDFRELVKTGLRYRWTGTVWSRSIDEAAGPLEDRVAEAGNRLLAAGFPVRIFAEDIRERAIAGRFEPERTRWIRAATGDYAATHVALSWSRDEDLYAAAKALPGSRYVKPFVVVPVARYEALRDFAEANDFAISPEATAALDGARGAYEAALLAKPAAAPTRRRPRGPVPAPAAGIAAELQDS